MGKILIILIVEIYMKIQYIWCIVLLSMLLSMLVLIYVDVDVDNMTVMMIMMIEIWYNNTI